MDKYMYIANLMFSEVIALLVKQIRWLHPGYSVKYSLLLKDYLYFKSLDVYLLL